MAAKNTTKVKKAKYDGQKISLEPVEFSHKPIVGGFEPSNPPKFIALAYSANEDIWAAWGGETEKEAANEAFNSTGNYGNESNLDKVFVFKVWF